MEVKRTLLIRPLGARHITKRFGCACCATGRYQERPPGYAADRPAVVANASPSGTDDRPGCHAVKYALLADGGL